MNVLLAALLLLQETPEQTFNKIESTIENAKNIKVLFTLMPASTPEELSRGLFSMEEENKLKLSADLRLKTGGRIAFWSEYENQKIKAGIGNARTEARCEGKTARQNFNVYLSRLGLLTGGIVDYTMWATSRGGSGKITIDLKQLFGVTNLKNVGAGPGNSRILSYEYTSAIKPIPFVWSKVWYDPKTYRLLKREVRWVYEKEEETIIEEYEIEMDGVKAGAAPATATPAPAGPPKSEAEQDVLFIQAKIQIATEHLKNGNKKKAIDVLEDLALSFKKHPLAPEINRLLEEARK